MYFWYYILHKSGNTLKFNKNNVVLGFLKVLKYYNLKCDLLKIQYNLTFLIIIIARTSTIFLILGTTYILYYYIIGK